MANPHPTINWKTELGRVDFKTKTKRIMTQLYIDHLQETPFKYNDMGRCESDRVKWDILCKAYSKESRSGHINSRLRRLQDKESESSPRRHSNPTSVCTKMLSCKTCEAKTDRTESKNWQNWKKKDKSIIIAADFNTLISTTDKTTDRKSSRMEELNKTINHSI